MLLQGLGCKDCKMWLVPKEKCVVCGWVAGEDEMSRELRPNSIKGRCLRESPAVKIAGRLRVVSCSLREGHEGGHVAYEAHNEYAGKLVEWEE